MADTTTTVYALTKPDKGKQDWDVPLNTNFDTIDQGLACARTHQREASLPYAEALVVKPQPGNCQSYCLVTGNITSMAFDWTDFDAVTKPGNMKTYQLKLHPSANISIAWPSNVVWMNGAVPRLNGTKVMRIQFQHWTGANTMIGSFMGWEG